ncbi:hypothetical protein ABKN59_001784 [Abortiporus biennis]
MATSTAPNQVWLPSDIAAQTDLSDVVLSATFEAYMWDFSMSLIEEYSVLSQNRRRPSALVYLLARLSSFALVVSSFVFDTQNNIEDCHGLAKSIGWFGGIAMPLNSLLFFFRAKAVFNDNKPVVYSFALLWIAMLGCLSAPFAVDGAEYIGTMRYCVTSTVKPYSAAGIFIIGVHDTVVFFAITLRLTVISSAETWYDRVKMFFSGRGMGSISKVLLTSGQLYYSATVGLNIVTIILLVSPSVGDVICATFAVSNVALQNAMACRVYRQLRLGFIQDVVDSDA